MIVLVGTHSFVALIAYLCGRHWKRRLCKEGKNVRNGGHAWWYFKDTPARKCNCCGKIELAYRTESYGERHWKYPTEPQPIGVSYTRGQEQ